MFEVSYDWYNETKSILLISIEPENWNWEDAVLVMEEKLKWMQQVEHEVHVIYQFTFPPRIPKNNIFRHINKLMVMSADNEGMSIFVGTNRIFEGFITTVATIGQMMWVHHKYRYVATLEQALAEIDHYDFQQYDEV